MSEKKKILVVDDNPLILRLCRMVLAKAGFQLIPTASPLAGLQALERHANVAAILLDGGFQSPTTEQILEGLESKRNTSMIPIILLVTGEDQPNPLLERFPSIWGTVMKPFSPLTLLQAVQKATKKDVPQFIQEKREKKEPTPPSPPPNNTKLPQPTSTLSSTEKSKPKNIFPSHVHQATPAFQGQIEFLPITEIIQILQIQKQTGVLHVSQGEREIFIYFDQGLIQFAHALSFPREFLLGRILIQSRKVQPEHVFSLIREKQQTSIPLGTFLIQRNFIDLNLLRQALKEQTCQLVFELLRWKKGDFRFDRLHTLPPLVQQAHLQLKTDLILLEGFKRIDEWNVLENAVGPEDTVLIRSPQALSQGHQLSEMEQHVLSLVNGSSTIAEIKDKIMCSSLESYKIFHGLLQRKILSPRLSAN